MKKVLFVCLGNICRSPTAHGIFQKMVIEAGLGEQVLVDSAGTGTWHIGHGPDPRSIKCAQKRGVDLSGLRARTVDRDDFEEFDYILAMDASNKKNLLALCPAKYQDKVQLFLEYSFQKEYKEVPDPYMGEGGFDLVFNLLEDACKGLLLALKKSL